MLNSLLHSKVFTSIRKDIPLRNGQVHEKAIHKRIPNVCVDRQTYMQIYA